MNYSIQLEQYILSCMVTYKECAAEVELLSEDDFVDSINKKIYQCIKDLVRENTNFDYMILIQRIGKEINSNALSFLVQTNALKINWNEYVKQLKDLTVKRKCVKLAEEIINSSATGEEISEHIEKQIFDIRQNTHTEQFEDISGIAKTVLKDIREQQNIKGYTGLETGFTKLDKLTNGLQAPDYILIGARPSMGKTAFAINISTNIANNGKRVALFSLEMSKKQIVKRILLSQSRVSAEKITSKSLKINDYTKLDNACNNFNNSNIYINDNAALSIAQMKSMCRKLKRNKGLDLVVIDYLQLIRSKEGSSRREQVEAVSRDLKAMAKELNVPIIVISSLSRANETRNNKQPILSDLRETGQIEFDADLIMFLHREYYYTHKEDDKNKAELIVAKQRNGSIGLIQLGWIEEYTRFINYEELDKRHDEPIQIEGFTQISY